MRTDNKFLKIALLLGLLGILVSGWLLSIHIRFSTGQAGLTESCSILPISGTGCATIAVSNFSDIFGIPLAAIALGYYFTQILLIFWAMRNYQAAYEPLYVSFFLASLAILVTVSLYIVSRFVIGSFCPGCAVLWAVNLLLWPSLVKHLGLRWSNALAANLELVRKKDLNLQKNRIVNSFAVGAAMLIVFSVIGLAAARIDSPQLPPGSPSFIEEYQNATQVFLPAEAYGGQQAKGKLAVENGAPVLDIVEFSDFQCPACRMAAQMLRPLFLKYKEKIRFSYRHFPLDGACNPHAPNGRHVMACEASRTGICAAKQDKFWPYHDMIFDHQDELSSGLIESIARDVGLDMNQLASCLKDPATETQLQKEMQWGELIGLESTPTLVINGRKISGARPPSELEALLNHLEKAGK